MKTYKLTQGIFVKVFLIAFTLFSLQINAQTTPVSVFNYPGLNGGPGCDGENGNLIGIIGALPDYSVDGSITSFSNSTTLASQLNACTFFFMTDMESQDPNNTTFFPVASRDVFKNWVNNGGVIVMTGTYGNYDTDFLNLIFSWNLVTASGSSWAKNTTNTAGTPFDAVTASSLPNLSATDAISKGTVPDFKAMWGDDTNATVAVIKYGAGTVIFMGYDFYDAGPLCGQYSSDWVQKIVPSALKYASELSEGAVTNITYTSADFSYTYSQSGTSYYVLVPAGSTAPTAAQVKAGVSYSGVTIIKNGSSATTINVPYVFNLTGLTDNTGYDIHTVTEYNPGTGIVFSAVKKNNFATLANDLPVGAAIANQTTCINGSLSGISLTITDAYPGDNTYTVTGSSSNTSLVPNGNIVITGSGSSRSIAITPNTGISGTSTITISMTDSLGATGTRTFTVTFNDLINPTITAPSAVSATTNTACTATGVSLGTPTTADNCGVAYVTNNAPTAFPLGNTTVTWTVTDVGGRTATATQTVTVTDNVNPTITAPAAVNTTINTACTATGVSLGTPTTADNCSVASVTNNHASTTYPLGETTVTWTVTDGSGRTATATQLVTVTENVNPTITAPANVNVTADTACIATGVTLGTPTTADNCTVANVTNNHPSSTYSLGVNTVIWTVTDSAGNTATATQTVTVTDNVNPTITAPASVNTTTNTACTATSVSLGTPVTADNCSVASVTNNAPTNFPLGDTTVTWTVTDGSGNTATTTQLVSVGDVIYPVVKTKNATVYLNNLGQAIVTPAMIDNGTTDNCDFSLIVSPNNFVCGNVGVNNVILIATDASGNQTIRPAIVTIVDNLPPSITAPSAVSPIANASCGATGVALGTPITADNCFIDTPAVNNAPSTFPLGATTVTWTVTDRSGNSNTATQIVTVLDTQNPTIATLAATSVNADAGVCTYASSQLTKPSAADNCSVIVTASPASLALGSNTVTWTATDGSGNTATSTQTVTVVDSQMPTIITPSNVIVKANASCSATGVDLGTPTTTDNCSVALLANDAPAIFELGNTTVIWTVTDGSGNTATANQTVTVVDDQNPTITAPAAVTAKADTDGVAIGVVLGTPITADNCTVASVTNDAPASFPIGVTTVIWTVTDGSENSTTDTQIVTILDEINPTITCVENLNVNNDAGKCGAIVSYALPTFSDNSKSVELKQTAGLASGSLFPIGTTTNTFLATDGSGNTSTCSFDVIVTDNEKPNVLTQNITVELDPNGLATITAAMINSGSTDNCTIESYSLDINSFDCSNIGTVEVTLTVNDVNGNSASKTAIVTVVDSLKPSLVTLSAISVNADADVCSYASSQLTAPAALDNCSVASVVASPASLALGANTVTWTVTDGSGNIETSTQIVTVVDSQIPTIATLDAISVNADSGVCTYESSQLTAPKAIDNCSVASVVASPASLVLGSNTVTWTVTDGSGLTETSIQIVTVVDSQNPTIATLNPISVNADSGVCTYASSQLTAPTAADNCSVASVLASPSSLDLGANTVTWTVTDGSGLTATSAQTVTVVDIQKPTIAVLDVVVSANASCNATGVDLGTPTTTDNCSVALVTNNAPTTFPLGDTTVTWTVTDGSGNTATTTQLVTVKDTTLPTITAPAAVDGNVNASCGATGVVIGNAITADNCSVVSVTNDAPAIFPLGETTVTWTVTDGSGNTATATQLVTMGDTIFPVVKAKNATVYLNSLGQAIILPSLIDNGTTDNCAFTLTVSPNNLVCANVGQNNVLLIATDASGNQSFKPATITLVDNLAPVIVAPLSVSANANAACSATGIILGTPVTTDNCTVDTVTNNAPATFPMGVTTVTWTATDRSGNSATATQTVTVTDSVLPTVKTKDITIVLDASGNATLTAAEIDNGSSDNCGISTMTLSQDTFTISDIGIKTITLTVTDNNGNTSSATAQVTVDGTLGTINLKSNLFVIYPIPFDSYINITLPDSYTDDVIYIQIYDLTGRAVYNQKHLVDNHNLTISDLNQYSDGSYYINLLDGKQTVIQSKHILKKTKQ
jgi:hypothetical protein